jgi:hypothetical protein
MTIDLFQTYTLSRACKPPPVEGAGAGLPASPNPGRGPSKKRRQLYGRGRALLTLGARALRRRRTDRDVHTLPYWYPYKRSKE